MIFILFSIYISYLDRTKRQHIAIPLKQEDAQTFDTICLNDPENINSNQDGVDGLTMPVLPQKTWTEMHDEFYAEPPKNPGKILLLYSPDTKQFKELQVSFTIGLEFIQLRKHTTYVLYVKKFMTSFLSLFRKRSEISWKWHVIVLFWICLMRHFFKLFVMIPKSGWQIYLR